MRVFRCLGIPAACALLFAAGQPLEAQLNCPPIDFLNVRTDDLAGGSQATALVRVLPEDAGEEGVPPFYYVGDLHSTRAPYPLIGKNNAAADRLGNCIPRQPTGRPPRIVNGLPLGTASPRVLVDTALVGPDLGGGLWSFFGRRNLLLLGNQDHSFREEMELDIGPSTRGFLSADYDKNGRR